MKGESHVEQDEHGVLAVVVFKRSEDMEQHDQSE